MRALVISNMAPDASHPERGQFVRDQVAALRRLKGLDVEVYETPPGAAALLRACATLGGARLRERFDGRRRRAVRHDGERHEVERRDDEPFDVAHGHFSLSGLPALAVRAQLTGVTMHGTDVHHPRTREATRLLLPFIDLLVAVSRPLADALPGRAARRRAIVIPCGVELSRFSAMSRTEARKALGLREDGPLLLFPADPARREKRHDLAAALAEAAGAPLLTLGGVPPERVRLFVNAANAVVIPSAREGFGLAALEALACDVPVLATPVGIHESALSGLSGALCAPFDLSVWLAALKEPLRHEELRIEGRERAARFSTDRMAERLSTAWTDALRKPRASAGNRLRKSVSDAVARRTEVRARASGSRNAKNG